MRELSDDDALWIGQGVPLMDSRNAETIALVRAGYRAAQAMTEGPAADPIADLCARLRDEYDGCPSPVTTARVATLREAADALERLRAERAEAERDALRECVKAADAMRLHVRPCRCETCGRPECDAPREYDRARAAWKDEV